MTFGKRKTRVEHGLHIVRKLRKDKPALWYVYAYRGGPQIHTAEGERPTITRAMQDMAAEASKIRSRVEANNIASLIADYQRSPEWDRLGDRTKKDYRIDLGKVAAKFGTVPLTVFADQKMRADVMDWRADMAGKPRTADKAIVMLSTLLSWGVTNGKLRHNVAMGIPMLYSANRASIIWTDADWQAIEPHCSKGLWHAIRLASMTGLRLGDLVKVEWKHVFPKSIVYITSKRKKRVVIPLLAELDALLDEIGRGEGTILKNSRGQPWTESGLGGVFQKAKKAAPGFNISLRIHDMRGTYATWLANKGLTDQEIGRIVAWSEKQVAEIRRRYVDEEHVVSSLVDRLNRKSV